jgi:hypothetical protein
MSCSLARLPQRSMVNTLVVTKVSFPFGAVLPMAMEVSLVQRRRRSGLPSASAVFVTR